MNVLKKLRQKLLNPVIVKQDMILAKLADKLDPLMARQDMILAKLTDKLDIGGGG